MTDDGFLLWRGLFFFFGAPGVVGEFENNRFLAFGLRTEFMVLVLRILFFFGAPGGDLFRATGLLGGVRIARSCFSSTIAAFLKLFTLRVLPTNRMILIFKLLILLII